MVKKGLFVFIGFNRAILPLALVSRKRNNEWGKMGATRESRC
jgi:hypothetical protein